MINLKWTKKPIPCRKHIKGEWTACRISNRVEVRTKIPSSCGLVIKIEDLRLINGINKKTKYGKYLFRRKQELIQNGHFFQIKFGADSSFQLTQSSLKDMYFVIQHIIIEMNIHYEKVKHELL